MIVHRRDIRHRLGRVLRKLTHQPAIGEPELAVNPTLDLVQEAEQGESPVDAEPAVVDAQAEVPETGAEDASSASDEVPADSADERR